MYAAVWSANLAAKIGFEGLVTDSDKDCVTGVEIEQFIEEQFSVIAIRYAIIMLVFHLTSVAKSRRYDRIVILYIYNARIWL